MTKLVLTRTEMRFLFIFTCQLYCQSISAQEDWLGSDTVGGFLGLRYGFYQGSAYNAGIDGTLPFFGYSQTHFLYTEFQNSDGAGTEQWALYWNSDPLRRTSVGVGYDHNGKGSFIENRDYHIYADYEINAAWSLRGKALYGEIEIDIGDIPDDIRQQIQSLDTFSRTRQGFGLSIGFDAEAWGARLSSNVYDYESIGYPALEQIGENTRLLDDGALEEARFFLQIMYFRLYERFGELGFTDEQSREFSDAIFARNESEIRSWTQNQLDQRRALDMSQTRFFYRTTYGRQSLLSKSDVGSEVYWNRDKLQPIVGFLAYESYITEEYSTQVYSAFDYQLSEHVLLGALINYSDDASEIYSELSVGISW